MHGETSTSRTLYYAGPVSIVDGAITGVGDVTSTGNVTAENVIAIRIGLGNDLVREP